MLELTWEYEQNSPDFGGCGEFFHARFTADQLFEFAAKSGLLETTASRKKPVPRGLTAAMRLTTASAS